MARPRTSTQMIVAEADGTFLFWMDGAFSGDDRRLVANVRAAARTNLAMPLTAHGPVLTASDFDPVGATAALLAAMPGRVTILSAPDSVLNLFPEEEPQEEDDYIVLDGAHEGDGTVRISDV